MDELDYSYGIEVESSPIDVPQLIAILGGNVAAVRDIAHVMRSDLAERRVAITRALGQRDAATGLQQVHALQGALASIHALNASRLAKSLKDAWRRSDRATLAVAAALFERELQRVDGALKRLLEGDG